MSDIALGVLQRRENVFADAFVDKIVGMKNDKDVKEAYEKFDKGVWGKVVFDPWS